MSTTVDSTRYTGKPYDTRYGCVYRAYDSDGVLLYIGSTCDFENRRAMHMKGSIWRSQVTRWRVRWYLNDHDALRAEAAAIRDEHPRWNIRHRSAEHPDGFARTIRAVAALHSQAAS